MKPWLTPQKKMVVHALGATIDQFFKSFPATLSSAGASQLSQEMITTGNSR
jgi:hypothetical protein